MKKTAFFLSVLFSVAIAQADGGAASLVAKNSKSGGFTYSQETRLFFMHDCSENADEKVCGCVFNKLQKRYSEKEYNKLDSELRKGYENTDFTEFISAAARSCDEDVGKTGPILSKEEAQSIVDDILKRNDKKTYIANCSSGLKAFLDEKGAKKTCGCMYNRFMKDGPHLVKVIMENGSLPEDNFWAFDYVVECVPDKMTPGIKKHFVTYMNDSGIPQSVSQCMIDAVAKEYTMKSLFRVMLKNPDDFNAIFIAMGTRCLITQ